MSQEIVDKINKLKAERNAVILVHNYQRPEVQDIGDYVGDSLGLSRQAAATDADVIVFCGVHFMAETAASLCPGKTVLIPDEHAGCPMANMVTPRELQAFKDQYPGAIVVTYVNSTAATKALSDICVTSANAVEVVGKIPADQTVLFVPDRNLGSYVASQLKRDNIVLWQGYCPTHERIMPEHIVAARLAHPGAPVVIHPECRPDVVAMADHVGSTTGILNFCRDSSAREFIIATESGMLYRLEKENPGKAFHPASPILDCPNMKLATLEKVLWCLEDMAPVVTVPEEIAEKARRPIDRMLEMTEN